MGWRGADGGSRGRGSESADAERAHGRGGAEVVEIQSERLYIVVYDLVVGGLVGSGQGGVYQVWVATHDLAKLSEAGAPLWGGGVIAAEVVPLCQGLCLRSADGWGRPGQVVHAVKDSSLCVEHLVLQKTTHALQDDRHGGGCVHHNAGVSEQG